MMCIDGIVIGLETNLKTIQEVTYLKEELYRLGVTLNESKR